jgi:aryl-alcohol dehydrogenase-like predicted oxidoreductase
MECRVLGRTGLNVTVLGFGAMEIRGPRIWGGRPVADEQAGRILNAVLDAGINFVDTSYDYGRSEEFIGRFISARRGDYYLATKCGCVVTPGADKDETTHEWTRQRLLHNIETSLTRMKTDHVDIWQIHNAPVEAVESGDLVKVMEDVRKQGKTRWIGISSTAPAIQTYIRWGVFDTFQIPYSALERQHEQIISAAAAGGAGIIIRGGVARGDPQTQGLGRKDRWEAWTKAGLDELLAPGEDRTGFLLRYTISHPDMDTTIVGTLSPEHLAANLAAVAAGPLAADVYEEAKRRLSAAGEAPLAV